ncbi:bromodomain-containing protein 8 isoform X4 [Thrips palmi]|uniref:Bromodomain-containing protein 8 isoform X4 n=1 Tax=Thrips palmi TaxID=161013 RepID=A0A6P9A448_THRPL|nr:bromodomain-containing protein 8 isoform X4 [Thrips palmi]
MASVEEVLKLKRGQVDPWSIREKLCLASSVVRSGNQNWMSVSRSLRGFGGEPGRPADWFSQKSCAVQYDNLLTQIETPKRKKRGADGSKAEGVDLTPAEVIVKQLTGERIEELRKLMAEARAVYMRDKEDLCLVQNGQADDRLQDLILQIQEEKKQEEAKQEEQQRYLRQREERKQEMEMAWRPHAAQQHTRGAGSQAARRPSNQSELGSETDNLESPSEQPTTTEEVVEPKPVSTPTSPLLTSLLKSPSPVTGVQSSSILHSAITSQRGASPTITSLLNSSPGVPSSTTSIPSSPNIKSLVSNALAGHDDVPKPQPHSTSSSPTLSMLLELPPSTPGKLPELPPYSATSATKQPVRPVSTPTSKPDTLKKEPLPENVEIVLPEGTETRVPETESKVSLDAADLQQLSTDELEQYVVDPASIGVVLEELVPGLVDGDGVCLLNLEDADVSNMLEANETNEGTVAEPVTDQVETNSNKDDEVPQGDVKEQIEPVSVMHTSPAHQSPQRAIATPQSAAPSPRIAGRPSKGNMVARNIVMEQEELAKPSTVQSNSPQVVGDTETLSREDLENASIVFMQDGMLVQGGVVMQDDLVMNLNESRQTASIVNDIQVLQDAPNSSVVVIPHEDVASEKEVDITQAVLPSSVCESVSVAVESDKCVTPKKDDQKVENRSPSKTPLKSSEVSPIKKIADDTKVKSDSPAAKLSKLPANEVEKTDTPELQEVSKTAAPAPSIQENAKENVAEVTEVESTKKPSPLSPREKLPKPKPVPPTKRDKSPVVSESSNEVASEDDSVKEEILDEPKNDSDLKIPVKKTEEEKKSSASKVQMEDENARDADADPPAVQIKEEKIRADTPSTEDDNTRDIEPPQPVKRGRGRYARESIASSDSVPNSPAATNVSADDEKDYRSWKKSIMLVYNRIAQHKNSSIFLKPITDDIAPEYSSMILRPFDLQTIKKNIENGRIRTTDEFQRDIMIMFNNAIMYNKSNSPVHIMAREMQEEGVMHLNEFKNTQLVLQTVGSEGGQLLSRRGTRTADKRDQDSDGISSRRSGSVTGLLGKRKRSMPDDRVTPKRRRDDD